MSAPKLSFPEHTTNLLATRTKSKSPKGSSDGVAKNDVTPTKSRTFIRKINHKETDVLISSNGVRHNYEKVVRTYKPDGHYNDCPSRALGDGATTLFVAIRKMTDEKKTAFFSENEFEIIVDLRDISFKNELPDSVTDGVMEREIGDILWFMESLGPEFPKLAKKIVIALYLPVTPLWKGSIKNEVLAVQESPASELVRYLVNHLSSFVAIEQLRIILHVQYHAEDRYGLEHRNLAILAPFYELAFQDWKLLWQNESRSRAVSVTKHHLGALNKYLLITKDSA